jgi:hypothetical protein
MVSQCLSGHCYFMESYSFICYMVFHFVVQQGVHPTIKGEVWEFLLGCYDLKSTTEQRNQLRQQRTFSPQLHFSFV